MDSNTKYILKDLKDRNIPTTPHICRNSLYIFPDYWDNTIIFSHTDSSSDMIISIDTLKEWLDKVIKCKEELNIARS